MFSSRDTCSWNDNSCEEVACYNIINYDSCLSASKRCYWSQGKCQVFTNCSSIQGSSQNSCLNSNYYCPATNGTNCGPIEQMKPCSAYQTRSYCSQQYSKDGYCIWNGSNCILASSCADFQAYYYPCDTAGCYLSNHTCQPITCSYYKYKSECQWGLAIFGPYLQNTVACQWNLNSQTCEDFDPSTVDQSQCLQNSFGTYCWSNTKKSCQQCYDRLLEIIFVVFISLIQ